MISIWFHLLSHLICVQLVRGRPGAIGGALPPGLVRETFCQLRSLLVIAAARSAAGAAVTEEKLGIRDCEFLKIQNDIHFVSSPLDSDFRLACMRESPEHRRKAAPRPTSRLRDLLCPAKLLGVIAATGSAAGAAIPKEKFGIRNR